MTAERATRPPQQGTREVPFSMRENPDDGLTFDGWGAVFYSRTVIDSYEGRFLEQIAQRSMQRSFRETPPKVQFDHGRHPMIGSIPIAKLERIAEEVDPVHAPNGGAHVIARVFDNWLTEPLRDAMDAKAVDGMSFRFSVVRETWEMADGTPIRDERQLMDVLRRALDLPEEELPVRTLKEVKVPEIGPVVWPAYKDTSLAMRSTVIDLGRIQQRDPEQLRLLAKAVFIADAVDSQQPTEEAGERQSTDSQQNTEEVVERQSTTENEDAQRSTPPVGERPSKPLSRNTLQLRNQRDTLIKIKQKGESR